MRKGLPQPVSVKGAVRMAAPPCSPRRCFFPAPPSDFYVFSAEHFISSDFGFSLSEAFPRLSAFCPPCPVPSDLPVSFSRLSTPWARRMIPFSVFRYEKSCDLNERSLGSRAFLPFIKSFGKGDGVRGKGESPFSKGVPLPPPSSSPLPSSLTLRGRRDVFPRGACPSFFYGGRAGWIYRRGGYRF